MKKRENDVHKGCCYRESCDKDLEKCCYLHKKTNKCVIGGCEK